MSCHQTSRPSCIDVPLSSASPSRRTTSDVLDGRASARPPSSTARLERDRLAAPPAAVGGDDQLGLGVVDPAGQRLGGEARRRRPCAARRSGRRRASRSAARDHRHVDRDPVAGRDAQLQQGVGRLLDLALEIGVGDGPGVARLADPVVRDLVAEAALDVAIDAVVGDVELAADEPLGERRSHSRVVWKSSTQSMRSRARAAQNASGSASARSYRSAVAFAWAVNAGSGGKVRSSARRFSISGVDDGDGSMLTRGTLRSRDWPGHPTAGGPAGAAPDAMGNHPLRVRTPGSAADHDEGDRTPDRTPIARRAS